MGGKLLDSIWDFYFKHYKILLFMPILLAILSIFQIAHHVQTTGDFITKDITLRGGITLTILENSQIDTMELQKYLEPEFTGHMVTIRTLNSAGKRLGFVIESDIQSIDSSTLDSILEKVGDKLGRKLESKDYSVETLGSALGASFFNQTVRAMFIAFIFMALVVLLYFRSFVPSITVISCVFSDIVTTIAIVNLLGIQVGTAGIAAILMLIGYSVDTDMLLTTRVLRRKENTARSAIIGAFKTGMMMTLTALAALTVSIFFTQSEVIRQIMVIVFIGLLVDILNTWVQNSGIILWYVEKKSK